MINTESIIEVDKSIFADAKRKPLYDSYNITNIPSAIESILLPGAVDSLLPKDALPPGDYSKVVMVVIDGFGWNQIEKRLSSDPFLGSVEKTGVVSKITSQFPSTTSGALTTMHTGLASNQTGVYEWFYYEPDVDKVIAPLLYSRAGDIFLHESLKEMAPDPSAIFPFESIYRRLSNNGVPSEVFQYKDIAHSSFSQVAFDGATISPFDSLEGGLDKLAEAVISEKGKKMFFLYYDGVDKASHSFGPSSDEAGASVDTLLKNLQAFYDKFDHKTSNTLFLLTADHGQLDVDKTNVFYLNINVPQIVPMLKRDREGGLIIPAGSPRDFFLHVKDDQIDDAFDLLKTELSPVADVYKTKDLVDNRLFGRLPESQRFLDRVGNVAILPKENNTVWWFEEGNFSQKNSGHHGGLTPAEIEIPLFALPL